LKKFHGGTGLALAFLLGLAGFFPAYGEDDPRYAGLSGFWSNNQRDREEKTLLIDMEGMTFVASLDPGMGRGTVSGKLAEKGGEYVLKEMVETTGRFWGLFVKSFNNTPMQVSFHDDDTFELRCATNKMVNTIFGGIFFRR
jgi:hypothetical protein